MRFISNTLFVNFGCYTILVPYVIKYPNPKCELNVRYLRFVWCNITMCNITMCNITMCNITMCNITMCNITMCNITMWNITKEKWYLMGLIQMLQITSQPAAKPSVFYYFSNLISLFYVNKNYIILLW